MSSAFNLYLVQKLLGTINFPGEISNRAPFGRLASDKSQLKEQIFDWSKLIYGLGCDSVG